MTRPEEGPSGLKRISIHKISGSDSAGADDAVAVEAPLTVRVNGEAVVTLMHTPSGAAELALGYLASEGAVSSMDDVESFVETVVDTGGEVDVRLREGLDTPKTSRLRVLTSGCGGGVTFSLPGGVKGIDKVESDLVLGQDDVRGLMDALRGEAPLFEVTGGTHAAALVCGGSIRASAEDIGRHNAVDKVLGRALIDGLDLSDCILAVTGRVSSEIALKCVRRGLSVLVSRGAPTSLAVELAGRFSLTLIGFARGKRFNVYAGGERLRLGGKT